MPRIASQVARTTASIAILSMAWGVVPASAEGPVYAVPSHPPPVKESVDFTNDLNRGARNLPAPLDPPVAESPEEVEARIRVLERGVVVEGGERKPKAHPRAPAAGAGEERRARAAEAPAADDAPPPLSAAFIGAGALALLGLLLSARGWRSGRSPGDGQ